MSWLCSWLYVLFSLVDIFSSNLNEIIRIKDDCFTLVPLGSSFKLAAVDVTASLYSSSAGSSFTFTNGGEGDLLVSACVVSYNRQRTKCSIMHSKHLTIDLIYMYDMITSYGRCSIQSGAGQNLLTWTVRQVENKRIFKRHCQHLVAPPLTHILNALGQPKVFRPFFERFASIVLTKFFGFSAVWGFSMSSG